MPLLRSFATAALALFGARGAAAAPSKAVVVVYDGYGTPDAFVVSGRVLLDQGERLPALGRSPWSNLHDNLRALESDEVAACPVVVEVGGARYEAVTDRDGVFVVTARDLATKLPPGSLRVTASAARADVDASPGDALVHVLDQQPRVAVVTDFDDTLVDTFVVDKKKLVGEVLFKNAAQLTAVKNAGPAYRALAEAGVGPFFYLSGSPQNFHPRIRAFLDRHGLPRGPLLLKNLGSDKLFKQEDYKAKRIRDLLQRFPTMRVLLVGDSGERDPEIYASIRRDHPERVVGIVIRRTAGSNTAPTRFDGMTVVDDYADAAALVAIARAALPPTTEASAP